MEKYAVRNYSWWQIQFGQRGDRIGFWRKFLRYAVRIGAAAAGLPETGVAEIAVYLAEDDGGKRDRIRNRMVRGQIESGQRIFQHSGGSVGGSSQLILYPDAHVVVAMICNFDNEWKVEEVESIAEGLEKK